MMKAAYYSAKVKCTILRAIGWLFHSWISDLAVRIYQHYPKEHEFFYVYRRSLQARAQGKDFVVITQEELTPVSPDPSKIVNFSNYLQRKRNIKKKR